MRAAPARSHGIESDTEGLRKKVRNLNRLLSNKVPASELVRMEAEFAKWKTRSRELNRSKFRKLETQLEIRDKKIQVMQSRIEALESELHGKRKPIENSD